MPDCLRPGSPCPGCPLPCWFPRAPNFGGFWSKRGCGGRFYGPRSTRPYVVGTDTKIGLARTPTLRAGSRRRRRFAATRTYAMRRASRPYGPRCSFGIVVLLPPVHRKAVHCLCLSFRQGYQVPTAPGYGKHFSLPFGQGKPGASHLASPPRAFQARRRRCFAPACGKHFPCASRKEARCFTPGTRQCLRHWHRRYLRHLPPPRFSSAGRLCLWHRPPSHFQCEGTTGAYGTCAPQGVSHLAPLLAPSAPKTPTGDGFGVFQTPPPIHASRE